MSVSAAVSRVAELQALVSPPAPTPAAPAAAPAQTSFASQLQTAQASAAPSAALGPAGGATQYDGLIQQAAQRNGVDPALLKGLIRQESNFNPNAGSPAGAQGLCQLMPGTAASLGVGDPRDPSQAIEGGARYLRQQLDAFGGDVTKALAAYNAGPGAVQRYGGVPPYAETQNYVRQVQAYAAQYRTAAPPAAIPTPATGLAYSTT